MTNYPTNIKMMPYSQKPTWLGIEWERPSDIEVDRFELYLSPKNIGNNEIEPLLTGAKEAEGVVKFVLPADLSSAVDNMSPQGKRTYYTIFAVGKDGTYVLPSFKVNDASRMDLKTPKYLKEPYAPATLKIIPYGQKPDGIGITWTAPEGEWAGFKVVVITGKNINKPEDFEKLFAGELDFVKLYEVGTDVTEVIDDATPQGTRNYYSVVAVDKKGNMVQVETFKAMRSFYSIPQILKGLSKLDLLGVMLKAYARRLQNGWEARNSHYQDVVKQMKAEYADKMNLTWEKTRDDISRRIQEFKERNAAFLARNNIKDRTEK